MKIAPVVSGHLVLMRTKVVQNINRMPVNSDKQKVRQVERQRDRKSKSQIARKEPVLFIIFWYGQTETWRITEAQNDEAFLLIQNPQEARYV